MLWDGPSISEAGEAEIAVIYLRLQKAARGDRWVGENLISWRIDFREERAKNKEKQREWGGRKKRKNLLMQSESSSCLDQSTKR